MKKHNLLLCLFTVCIAVVTGHAQAVFQKKYGHLAESKAWCSIRTSDGGYMIAGTTGIPSSYGLGRILLIKTDANAVLQWSQNYGSNMVEHISSVIQNPDGSYTLVGTTYSLQPYGDAMLMKVSNTGSLLWTKIYTGSQSEYGYDVVRLPGGDYVFAGLTRTNTVGGYDFYIVRTDSTGTPVWMNRFGGLANDEAQALVVADDGNLLVAGSGFVTPDGGLMLSKVNVATGALMWTKVYGNGPGGNGSGRDIVPAMNGGYYLVGWTSGTNSMQDIYVVKVDNNGIPLWSGSYGGSAGDFGHEACLASDGGLAVTGYTESFGAGGQDMYLLRLDSLGNVLWSATYGTAGQESAESVLEASDGGFLLSGVTTPSFSSGNFGMYIVKTDASGFSNCLYSTAAMVSYPDSMYYAVINPTAGTPSGSGTSTFSASPGLTDTTLCSTVAVADVTIQPNTFTLYPNPASGYVQVLMADHAEAVVTIYNTSGQICFSKPVFNIPVLEIETTGWIAGIYFAEVRSGNLVSRQKLIIR